MPEKRGLFVTFEGGEGAGKSTQVQLLRARLEAAGRRVINLREPGGTSLGEDLRRLLLNSTNIAPTSELLLFLAARAELVEKVIRPALNAGVDVLCDRFIDSTAAYQGYGRRLNLDLIDTLNAAVTEDCRPDLTVLLDVDPDIGLSRNSRSQAGDAIEGHWQQGLSFEEQGAKGNRGKRVGGRDKAFHRRVHKGYLALAKREPKRWLVLDATLPQDEIADRIWDRTRELLTARA